MKGREMDTPDIGLSLRQAVRRNADGIAVRTLTADGRQVATEMSWADLQKEVALLSRFLTQVPGLAPGVRLGVLGRNSAEYLQLMYACADAGVIVVPLNTRWAIGELRHAVMDSGIKVLAILDREFVGTALDLCTVAPTAGRVPSCLMVGPQACTSSPTAMARSEVSAWRRFSVGQVNRSEGDAEREGWRWVDDSRGDFVPAQAAEEGMGEQRLSDDHDCCDPAESVGVATLEADGTRDVFCIVYTSGSTGRSKGVALTHEGQVFQADAKCVQLGFTSSTTYLNVLPLFHVGGISAALAVTLVGGCHVFVPRFAPGCAVAAIQAGRVNSIVVVPTMLHMLVKEASSESSTSDDTAHPLAAIDTVVVGGQPMSGRLERLARGCMPGARFVQTYACTEAGSTIAFAFSPPLGASQRNPNGGCGAKSTVPERSHDLWATAGSPAEHVEIRVVERGPSDGPHPARPASAGTVGEVETRGPHVMKGYWNRPDLTAEAIRPDGWLRTGDLGRLDEISGQLMIVGRAKDVIKTGGEKVHSSEVESVLLRHVWVAEAAAYGVDDERLGEKVAASVVLDDAAQDDEGAITCDRARAVLDRFCGLHLSPYKRPRQIHVVPALPRNSAGKVLRHMLRAFL
ncbi:unnamed protein product [Ectocarpus sp. 13 AM-2016]